MLTGKASLQRRWQNRLQPAASMDHISSLAIVRVFFLVDDFCQSFFDVSVFKLIQNVRGDFIYQVVKE